MAGTVRSAETSRGLYWVEANSAFVAPTLRSKSMSDRLKVPPVLTHQEPIAGRPCCNSAGGFKSKEGASRLGFAHNPADGKPSRIVSLRQRKRSRQARYAIIAGGLSVLALGLLCALVWIVARW